MEPTCEESRGFKSPSSYSRRFYLSGNNRTPQHNHHRKTSQHQQVNKAEPNSPRQNQNHFAKHSGVTWSIGTQVSLVLEETEIPRQPRELHCTDGTAGRPVQGFAGSPPRPTGCSCQATVANLQPRLFSYHKSSTSADIWSFFRRSSYQSQLSQPTFCFKVGGPHILIEETSEFEESSFFSIR